MRLETMLREYTKNNQLTLVNKITRKHVANLSPFDNYFNAQRIIEATDLYQDLMDYGLLKPVLAALEKRKKSEQTEL